MYAAPTENYIYSTYLLMDGCCVPTDGYHAPAPVAGGGGLRHKAGRYE